MSFCKGRLQFIVGGNALGMVWNGRFGYVGGILIRCVTSTGIGWLSPLNSFIRILSPQYPYSTPKPHNWLYKENVVPMPSTNTVNRSQRVYRTEHYLSKQSSVRTGVQLPRRVLSCWFFCTKSYPVSQRTYSVLVLLDRNKRVKSGQVVFCGRFARIEVQMNPYTPHDARSKRLQFTSHNATLIIKRFPLESSADNKDSWYWPHSCLSRDPFYASKTIKSANSSNTLLNEFWMCWSNPAESVCPGAIRSPNLVHLALGPKGAVESVVRFVHTYPYQGHDFDCTISINTCSRCEWKRRPT